MWRLRLFWILTTGSFQRPYRALYKTVPLDAQPPTRDWALYRPF